MSENGTTTPYPTGGNITRRMAGLPVDPDPSPVQPDGCIFPFHPCEPTMDAGLQCVSCQRRFAAELAAYHADCEMLDGFDQMIRSLQCQRQSVVMRKLAYEHRVSPMRETEREEQYPDIFTRYSIERPVCPNGETTR